ncbi:MAG: NAD(P)-binding protein [Rhodospirillaceae bacterium]|jgi:NADPH-dependent glutamate synthase beta subunit-like oxidoreductase|nr:NAD(P)-binding protein [Rhodospirillaceae bacterium]MBT5939588.1 NAD(P)-binding protein [Rhodospirillaceae bacterium]MBT7268796.1 NAD(P)-binding protein [Rhodospirillaceae bacterium]
MDEISKDKKFTYLRYKPDDGSTPEWNTEHVNSGESGKCPTYVHRAPPCQGSCPSGHDIRGWLSIVRGLDKPQEGETWQENAFDRMIVANPFPSIMGRVCPAPCQDGCNRNEVEESVGINSVEQYVGDWALGQGKAFAPSEVESGKRIAVIGGGAGGLAAAYFLRLRGHGCTIFESYKELGGMMRFGIPSYRTPRDVLDGEIQRIIDMGVEVRLNTRIGEDVSVEELEKEYDAIFWAIGAQTGKPVPIPGAEAPNCIDGISFLKAFNEDRLQYLDGRILVVGAGDTAMDVAAVARRIGNIENSSEKDRPDNIIFSHTVHDVAEAARRQGGDVWVVYRRPIDKAPATEHELTSIIAEGVEIHESLAPLEVILDADGRATALRVVPVDWSSGEMVVKEGEEFNIDCTLIVSATGQAGDFAGLEEFDNGKGLMDADSFFQVPGKPGHFVGGDVINPHLLTTAIGHASIAVEGIDRYLQGDELKKRPKVDVHHFSLLQELRSHDLDPTEYDSQPTYGTDSGDFAVHNYEDRSSVEIIQAKDFFLGYYNHTPMHRRNEKEITKEKVLSNFEERFSGLEEQQAIDEAERCMSCGMCFECDNCLIYCPQNAISRVAKDSRAMGRYVDTDYSKCVGCYICADVCPSGYINMGLGGD